LSTTKGKSVAEFIARRGAEFRMAVAAATTAEMIRAMQRTASRANNVRELIQRARAGDVPAAALYFELLLDDPTDDEDLGRRLESLFAKRTEKTAARANARRKKAR
jgi:site-specific recombinase